jgi:hypothetical protein
MVYIIKHVFLFMNISIMNNITKNSVMSIIF